MQVALRVLFAVAILFSLVYSLEKDPKELELEDPDDDDDDDDDGDEDEDEGEEMAPIRQKMLQKLQDALTSEQIRSMHSKIDKNGDGRISLHEIMEFDAMMRKTIAKKDIDPFLDGVDGNKDGKLSLAELFKDIEREYEKREDETSEEVKKRKDNEAEKFNVADTDGDRFLKAEELPAFIHPEIHNGMLELVAGQTMKDKDVNGDGKLTSKEFWEGDSVSDEEKENFKKLDADKDGFINLEELKAWESGDFHMEEAMKKLVELSDKDRDMHVTADELDEARRLILETDAQYILMEWAEQEHHELRSALSTTNSEHQEL